MSETPVFDQMIAERQAIAAGVIHNANHVIDDIAYLPTRIMTRASFEQIEAALVRADFDGPIAPGRYVVNYDDLPEHMLPKYGDTYSKAEIRDNPELGYSFGESEE